MPAQIDKRPVTNRISIRTKKLSGNYQEGKLSELKGKKDVSEATRNHRVRKE